MWQWLQCRHPATFSLYSNISVSKLSLQTACHSTPPWEHIHTEISGDFPSEIHTDTHTHTQTHTHIHIHIHTQGVALWWDIILSFSMLCYKMYLPRQSSSSSNPSSVLVWCFPQGNTHRQGATHPGRWKEHGCHIINDSENLTLSFFFFFLACSPTCSLAPFLAHTDTRQTPAGTITQIFSVGATRIEMMTLPWSFCFSLLLTSNGSNQWNTRLSFSFASCYENNPHTAVWLLPPWLVFLSLWTLLSAPVK